MAKAALWAVPDAEARKLGERKGLDTPVVPAVNDGHQVFPREGECRRETIKCPTWGVRPQG